MSHTQTWSPKSKPEWHCPDQPARLSSNFTGGSAPLYTKLSTLREEKTQQLLQHIKQKQNKIYNENCIEPTLNTIIVLTWFTVVNTQLTFVQKYLTYRSILHATTLPTSWIWQSSCATTSTCMWPGVSCCCKTACRQLDMKPAMSLPNRWQTL